MGETTIEWCHYTANLWWGCQEVHEGCDACYARTWDKRMGGAHWGAHAPRRAIQSVWTNLTKWQQAAASAGEVRRVFCGSMMDIFEVSKPLVDRTGQVLGAETADLRDRLFYEVVPTCPNLLFLFLTKRPQNIRKMVPISWLKEPPANVMYGYSAVNQKTALTGVPALLDVPGRHFLSCEPLLGPIDLEMIPDALYGKVWPDTTMGRGGVGGQMITTEPGGIHWVIAGAESGHGARAMSLDWVRSLRDQCHYANVPFFFKQMLANGEKVSLPALDGVVWNQFPEGA